MIFQESTNDRRFTVNIIMVFLVGVGKKSIHSNDRIFLTSFCVCIDTLLTVKSSRNPVDDRSKFPRYKPGRGSHKESISVRLRRRCCCCGNSILRGDRNSSSPAAIGTRSHNNTIKNRVPKAYKWPRQRTPWQGLDPDPPESRPCAYQSPSKIVSVQVEDYVCLGTIRFRAHSDPLGPEPEHGERTGWSWRRATAGLEKSFSFVIVLSTPTASRVTAQLSCSEEDRNNINNNKKQQEEEYDWEFSLTRERERSHFSLFWSQKFPRRRSPRSKTYS